MATAGGMAARTAPPLLPDMMGMATQFPRRGGEEDDVEMADAPDALDLASPLFSYAGESPALDLDGGAASATSSLPVNPLASLVGTNLLQWMDEGEEAPPEGEEADFADDQEEEDEEQDQEDADMPDRPAAAASASTPPRKTSRAAVLAAAASANSAAASPAASSAKKKSPRKRRAAEVLADDSAELGEIMGTGYGGATSRGANRSSGKLLSVMRRGTRAGKISKLTPELEKKMGEANSAYINQEFARAVDILLHIIQSAPHAEGPYHTLGLIYEERNDLAKAIEAYLLAAHMSRRDWGLWKRVAKMASESGQLNHAVYCWTKVLGSEPDNDDIRWERAMAYFELKNFSRALDSYQYLLKKYPHHAEYLRQAASCFSHLKKPQAGVGLIMRYLEWFKDTVTENERLDKVAATSGQKTKKPKSAATPSSPAAPSLDPSATPSSARHLRKADLDIDLVNIMCELLLALHKYQEVVDTHEELLPYLRAAARKVMQPTTPEGEPESDAVAELPFDLHSKLGIAHLYLKEYTQAETIFAPILQTTAGAVRYDVDSWGDLYVDIAEAYVNNKIHPQAEKLLGQVAAAPAWASLRSKVHFLQARCAHAQAIAQIQTTWANPSATAAISHSDLLQHALRLYERVHIAEEGGNVDARLAMSEILQMLGEKEKAMDVLKGVDMEAHPTAMDAQLEDEDQAGPTSSASSKSRSGAGVPSSASSLRHLDDMRLFSQTCSLHLESGRITDFLAIALPILVNITNASMLVMEDDETPMQHPMEEPKVPEGEGAAARGLPAFPTLPVDKVNSFTAQRSMLTMEFLRPACAAIKHLYARDRLSEALWLIYHLDRLLLRYVHTHQSTSHHAGAAASGGTGSLSTALSVPGSTAHSTGVITSNMSFPEQARLVMLALKYVSAGIFLRFGDSEAAYHAIRGPLGYLPYSFPLCHTMNVILNQQSYPGKAIKTLERLLLKHPDSVPLRLLLGHGCLVHQNYECALQHYLAVYARLPQHALVLLLLGITKLQISLKKLNQHRHHDLTLAFAFLNKYVEAKKAQRTNQPAATQEAYYNLARAYQYVGLGYLAMPYYQRVLAISTNTPAQAPTPTPTMPSPGAAFATAPRVGSLHSDAAHNLACIYSQTGSPDLARRLYAQYCRV